MNRSPEPMRRRWREDSVMAFKEALLARSQEASSWRGLVYLLTALGISLSPEQGEAIVAAGLALSGLISVFLPDVIKLCRRNG